MILNQNLAQAVIIPPTARVIRLILLTIAFNPLLNAQNANSAYTQPFFIKTLQIVPPAQAITFPFWVDQTNSISMTISSLDKNLSIRFVNPSGAVFIFGQAIPGQFQCFVSPDPQVVPDAPGANYIMEFANPTKGQWSLQIQAPSVPLSPLTLPTHVVFNNQVGPVLFGGGDVNVGKPVSYSLAVMDGAANVSNLQITASLFRAGENAGNWQVIPFIDDGQKADYLSGDSIYSACIIPEAEGEYHLRLEVVGDASTGRFQRSVSSVFKAVPQTVRIIGTFKERVTIGTVQ